MPTISHRPLAASARHIGPSHPNTAVRATIHLRRRPGHALLSNFDDFRNCPDRGQRPSPDEFVAKWGASQDDANALVAHCQSHGLTVSEVHLGRRQLTVEGSVAQFNQAFVIDVHDYVKPAPKPGKSDIAFRAHGPVHLPDDLFPRVVGVFGIENDPLVHSSATAGDPTTVATPGDPRTLGTLYNFPPTPYTVNGVTSPNGFVATGQTIGLVALSGNGYNVTDLEFSAFYSNLNAQAGGYPYLFDGSQTNVVPLPSITDVSVDGTTNPGEGNGDHEISLDMMMLWWFCATPKIAVYFYNSTNTSLSSVFSRMVHPNSGDPVCTILSLSFGGDEAGFGSSELAAIDSIFEDAATLGITVLAATGDFGASNQLLAGNDGKVHVQYPAVSPWVTAVGGTVVGNISGSAFTEWVLNETVWSGTANTGGGATGGGISTIFPVPTYQQAVTTLPNNLNTGLPGRGIPDISGNASPHSGVDLVTASPVDGTPQFSNTGGTSMTCPMYAALVAVLSTKLGHNLGFLNPTLYAIGNANGIIRDIVTGSDSGGASSATSNGGWNGIAGYLVTTGWDAATGWGVIHGGKLLSYLQNPAGSSIKYWVQVQAFNAAGSGPMSAVAGPFTVLP